MTQAYSRRKADFGHDPIALRTRFGLMLWVSAVLSASVLLAAISSEVRAGESSGAMQLYFENGLLSARIENVPVRRVLAALERRAVIDVKQTSPANGALKISATLQSVSLTQGLRRILRDFSYAIDSTNGLVQVHLLSTRPKADSVTSLTAVSQSWQMHRAEPTRPIRPQTLDEFRPFILDGMAEDGDDDDEIALGLREQRHGEFFLGRALDALRSGEEQLHEEAIDALAYIDDERAALALTEIALGTSVSQSGNVSAARMRATMALSKRTASQGHLDDVTLEGVFERLASSEEEGVRAVALATLEDIRVQRAAAFPSE